LQLKRRTLGRDPTQLMPKYRVRTPFRAAAILLALLLPAGVVMLIGGLAGQTGHPGPALALVLLGLFGIGIGSLPLDRLDRSYSCERRGVRP
jgi:hypothetical protein